MTLPPPLDDDSPRPFTPRVLPRPEPRVLGRVASFAAGFIPMALLFAGVGVYLHRKGWV